MKTVYYTATTLDGFLADEQDNLDWLLKQPQDPDDSEFSYERFIAGVGALVMGSTTYRWVVDHHEWPYTLPTWVLSSRPQPAVPGADLRFAAGSVAELHPAWLEAANGRNVWVVGGGDLAGQFADAGLLDEIMVSIAPVTLGAGRPLLPRRYDLELLTTGRNAGFLCARYRVAGPLPASGATNRATASKT